MVSRCPISNAPGWPEVALAEITTKVGSGATPRGGAETYLDKRVEFALIRSQNVFDRYFDSDGLAYITNEQAENLRNAQVQQGDILLNITGDGITFGRACMAPEFILPACVNQHVSIIRVDKTRAEAGFLLAFLTHPDVKSYIESFNAGGSRRAITKGHIESFRLPLPPLNYQHVVAHVLGTIDDKIELNRKTNETLEEMARALFQSWFVDFDPVRAKAEGRTPSGMDAEIAGLFPSEFVDSDIGPVPKGWQVGAIANLAEIVGGSTPSTSEPSYWQDGAHYWATPKDLSSLTTPVVICTERKITDAGLRQISSGLLPVGTVLLSSRAPIGYLGIAEVPLAVNQGFIAMKPRAGVSSQFLLRWTDSAHNEIVSRANGSTFLEISKGNFRSIQLVVPPAPLMNAFDTIATSLYRYVVANEYEARSLTSLRDEQLPRLLTGELDVSALLSNPTG